MSNLNAFFSSLAAGDEGAIIILIATYFALAGTFSLLYCLRIRSWPSTEGILLDSGVEKWGFSMRRSDQEYEAVVRYKYGVAGQDYEGRRLSPTYVIATTRSVLKWQLSGIQYLADDTVAVFYNPRKPQKSFLIKPGKLVLSFLSSMILISLIVIIGQLR